MCSYLLFSCSPPYSLLSPIPFLLPLRSPTPSHFLLLTLSSSPSPPSLPLPPLPFPPFLLPSTHTLLHRLLASKNLPAAIEDTSGSELPESIREKAEAVQEAGGISSIEQMFYNLPDLLQTNREILDEVGAECRCEGGVCEC